MNYNIDLNNWDALHQRPIKKLLKDIDYANLDTDLSTLNNNLLKEYNKSKGLKDINTTWLKDFINPPQKEEKYPSRLVDYIDTYCININITSSLNHLFDLLLLCISVIHFVQLL